jgi:hypothetical protein
MDIVQIIGQIGVPAGIAVLVLVKLEAAMQKLEEALNKNTTVMAMLLGKMGFEKEALDRLDTGGKDKSASAMIRSVLI